MGTMNRRSFLKSTAAATAGTGLLSSPFASLSLAKGTSDTLNVGIIGCGGRARGLANEFAAQPNCRITWVCDPDSQRVGQMTDQLLKTKVPQKPTTTDDLRKILDDDNVDAVVIATPDHWHAPAAILACDAGKHVYVEKPCSHNLREGRLLVEAARRNKRTVQHGTQGRNTRILAAGVKLMQEGLIGDVLVAKAWNVQRRRNIGHAQPGEVPGHLNYDQWVGPAAWLPYQSNRLHYNWHWWYNFGTGDIGNDGVHELDFARWGLGVTRHPHRIAALGTKLFFNDDQQFPDTQQVAYEYAPETEGGQRKMLLFEMRIWSKNSPYKIDNGAEFYGTKGRLTVSKRGLIQFMDDNNQAVPISDKLPDVNVMSHAADFLEAIRNDRAPAAEIEIGHISSSLSHLGNISARVGRVLNFDPEKEQILGDEESANLLSRAYREGHWAVPEDVTVAST